eukprot:6133911-Pleurochrysis_carterae.AAC.1
MYLSLFCLSHSASIPTYPAYYLYLPDYVPTPPTTFLLNPPTHMLTRTKKALCPRTPPPPARALAPAPHLAVFSPSYLPLQVRPHIPSLKTAYILTNLPTYMPTSLPTHLRSLIFFPPPSPPSLPCSPLQAAYNELQSLKHLLSGAERARDATQRAAAAAENEGRRQQVCVGGGVRARALEHARMRACSDARHAHAHAHLRVPCLSLYGCA